jgi:hypothetical protein
MHSLDKHQAIRSRKELAQKQLESDCQPSQMATARQGSQETSGQQLQAEKETPAGSTSWTLPLQGSSRTSTEKHSGMNA